MSGGDNRVKVLMLGWEFPPVLTGGLGTACYGLCKALSQYADVTLIIPQAAKEQSLEGIKVLGINYLGLDPELPYDEPSEPIEHFAKVIPVPAPELSPYPLGIAYEEIEVKASDAASIRDLYSSNEAYGSNIMEKVRTFADVIAQVAAGKEFDVIHAHDWITYPAAVRLKELTGKPLVLHIHSLETDRVGPHAKHNKFNAVYEIERKGMEHADRLMPVSQYTMTCAVEHYGIDPRKFFPVYNAIDPVPTYRIPRETDEKIVLFLGRITYQKGPEFMAETAFKLIHKYPKVKFFVAGVGDQLDKLKDMTRQMGIDSHFIFAGFLSKPRVHQILAQADVYFMPSVSEPFGLSALEAAQFAIPCVLSAQSGVAEVMAHALKADYWDTDRFANYIYALLNYEGIRKDMTENSVKEIEQMSWDDSAREVMYVYRHALAGQAA